MMCMPAVCNYMCSTTCSRILKCVNRLRIMMRNFFFVLPFNKQQYFTYAHRQQDKNETLLPRIELAVFIYLHIFFWRLCCET